MTAFEVYLVMQADEFRSYLTCVGALLFITMVGMFVVGVALYVTDTSRMDGDPAPEDWGIKSGLKCLYLLFTMWLFISMIPDSKTLAAMYVVPAITSKEFVEPIGEEAKEVYELAKKALKNLAEDKDEDRSK